MRIEICAPMGTGKSTLARKLSEANNWKLIQEPVKKHPFLEAFYEDQKFSLEKNLFFLLHYMHDIKLCDNGGFIFDHANVLHKSYAALNSDDTDEANTFAALNKNIVNLGHPDLLINLTCSNEVILERIKSRGRDFESSVDINYISALNAEIEKQINSIEGELPILHIDSEKYNFADNQDDADEVISIINDYIDNLKA